MAFPSLCRKLIPSSPGVLTFFEDYCELEAGHEGKCRFLSSEEREKLRAQYDAANKR